MAGIEIQPFADEHVESAAALLAERHTRHCRAEPLLPTSVDFRAELEKEWRAEEASGVVALDGDDLVGYLIGHRREDPAGAHLWSFIAGHASREPEVIRDLYAVAAERWVESGLTRHFFYAPALDDLIDPWFRLSFGASAALAIRETAPTVAQVAEGLTIREGAAGDEEAAARLERYMTESMLPAPSFSAYPPDPFEESVAEWRGTWEEPDTYRHFVAEHEGRVVGHVLLYRRPADLRVPVGSIDLAQASTEPAERGAGIGVALTAHVLTWAHDHGFETMTTDWRMTNLLASRFWPRRGFRPVFLRLYRSIP